MNKLWISMGTILLAAGSVGLFYSNHLKSTSEVQVGLIKYIFENGSGVTVTHPSFVPSSGGLVRMEVPIEIDGAIPGFRIHPDDCIEQITINGQIVDDPALHFCDFTELGPFKDLSPYLRTGSNAIMLAVRDYGGLTGVRLTPVEPQSSHNWLPFLLLCIAVGILLLLRNRTKHQILLGIVIFGILLRILYVAATPYTVRGHDTGSHIEYIEFVAENWSIPPASRGWEFHQAPLYYFLAAVWYRFGETVGFAREVLLKQIQVASFLVSSGTLLISLWIAFLLFPEEREKMQRHLFVLVIAVFPSLVFLAARITNDGLYHFFAFLTVALLIRWWRLQREKDWCTLWVGIALSFITKVSGLILLPVALFSYFRMQRGKRIVWRQLLSGFLLFLALAGWLPVGRFFMEQDTRNSVTFGSQSMHPGLKVETSLSNLTMFNPVAVLQNPFNSPWDDAKRRQYFWEYFFRSAFFGEFGYPESTRTVATALLLLALSLLPFLAWGLYKEARDLYRASLPMLLLLGFLLAAHVVYRTVAPFASNQDFRFSVLTVVPLTYFLLRGTSTLRNNFQLFCQALLIAFSFSAASFLLLLYFQ